MAYSWTSQVSIAASASSGAALNLSVTYAAHDRVQVLITYGSATTITETLSDGTNTYSLLGHVNIAADTQTYSIYECKDAAAGTFTLAFTPGSAQAFRGICAANQAGLDNTTAGQEIGQTQASPGTGANAITSTTLTPASQPGMLMGFGIDDAGSAVTVSAGTGFTTRGTIANWDSGIGDISRVEDIRLTATTAKAATFTASSAPGHTVAFAVFVPESGGAVAPTYPQLEHATGRGSFRGMGLGIR